MDKHQMTFHFCHQKCRNQFLSHPMMSNTQSDGNVFGKNIKWHLTWYDHQNLNNISNGSWNFVFNQYSKTMEPEYNGHYHYQLDIISVMSVLFGCCCCCFPIMTNETNENKFILTPFLEFYFVDNWKIIVWVLLLEW